MRCDQDLTPVCSDGAPSSLFLTSSVAIFQAYFEVADQSGTMSLVLWNDRCPEFYQSLSVGTVLYIQNYTLKQSYSNRTRPQMDHHRMKSLNSVGVYRCIVGCLKGLNHSIHRRPECHISICVFSRDLPEPSEPCFSPHGGLPKEGTASVEVARGSLPIRHQVMNWHQTKV